MIALVVCFSFLPRTFLFPEHVVPSSLILPFKRLLLKYRHTCSQGGGGRPAFSHSLSLRVQLRGLVCAWVPGIMITAAEKYIFTFQEIRAGNLQAEDLTSSLWLIVELTEKSPRPTATLHRHLGRTSENTHLSLSPVTEEWLWHYIQKRVPTMRHHVPIGPLFTFFQCWFIFYKEMKSGTISQRETKSNISVQRKLDVRATLTFNLNPLVRRRLPGAADTPSGSFTSENQTFSWTLSWEESGRTL